MNVSALWNFYCSNVVDPVHFSSRASFSLEFEFRPVLQPLVQFFIYLGKILYWESRMSGCR